MGPTNVAVAKLEAPSSLRALYGTEGAANATHGSKTPEAAAAEIPFFFPRIAPTTLLSNEEAKAQLQAQVAPLLSEALVELAKAKPQVTFHRHSSRAFQRLLTALLKSF